MDALRLLQQGRLEEAETRLRQILLRNPSDPEANHALGRLAMQARELEAGVALLIKAAELRPQHRPYALAAARALHEAGRIPEALARLDRLIARHPGEAEAYHLKGILLSQTGPLPEALAAHRLAHALAPEKFEFVVELARSLLATEKFDEVPPLLEQPAFQTPPGKRAAAWLRAEHAHRQRRFWAALQGYDALLREHYENYKAWNNLGELWRQLGRPERAVAAFDESIRLNPADPQPRGNRLVALCYFDGIDPARLCAEGREWNRLHAPPPIPLPPPLPRTNRRIRVGYYSPDWREHATCAFTRHLLQHHDRTRFEIFIYRDAAGEDALTAQFRGWADHWRDTFRLSVKAAAECIAADNLDVLIDIPGHFGNPRATVIASRPAREIIHYLGHAGTTGISAIGWRIADDIAEPPPDDSRLSTERILRLPRGFHPYLGATHSTDVAALPARTQPVTFGTVNSLAKISPSSIRAWAAVLAALPGTRFLVAREELVEEPVREDLIAKFAAEGFPLDRLVLRWTPGTFRNLAAWNEIDVALDTFPYNGVTTTCDALWMGVPVLTLRGDRFIARSSASILSHVGRSEWICENIADLTQRASQLISDLDTLARIRAGLRDEFLASPLGQVETLTRDFEAAYLQVVNANATP